MLIYLINDALHGKLRYICYLFLLREAENSKQFIRGHLEIGLSNNSVAPTSRGSSWYFPLNGFFGGRPHSQTLLKYSRLLVISYSYIPRCFGNHCQYVTIRWSYPIYSHCIPSVVHYSHCVLKNPDSFPCRIYSHHYTYSYDSFSQIKSP